MPGAAVTALAIHDNPARPSNGHRLPTPPAEGYILMNLPQGPRPAVSFSQAIDNSPPLARLAGMVRESGELLKSIESLLPPAIRPAVNAGPIDGEVWCLLVAGNAAAAKLRQLLPVLQARLQGQGHKITTIRLKVLLAGPRR